MFFQNQFSSSPSFCKYSTMSADHLRLAKEHLEQVWTGTRSKVKKSKSFKTLSYGLRRASNVGRDNIPQTSSIIYVHLKKSSLNGQTGSHFAW